MVLFAVTNVMAQGTESLERKIYIWDVTLSMQGKGSKPTPDVYDEVERHLINDINSISRTSTEVVVIPFQDKVLEYFKIENSSPENKTKIIEWIKQGKSKYTDMTYTNIVDPLKYAKDNFQKSDRRNFITLLTDGEHNMPNRGGAQELKKAVKEWDEESVNSYLVYVQITEAADIDLPTDLNNVVVIKPGEPYTVSDQVPVKGIFNIRNDKSLIISFNGSSNLPEGVKVAVRTVGDSPISVDEEVEIVNKMIEVTPQFNLEELKNSLPENTPVKLQLEVLNGKEIEALHHIKVVLLPSEVNVTVKNVRERVLTIKMRE